MKQHEAQDTATSDLGGTKSRSRSNSQPQSILKSRDSSPKVSPHAAAGGDQQLQNSESPDVRGIMKVPSQENVVAGKGANSNSSQHNALLKTALRRSSVDSEGENANTTNTVLRRSALKNNNFSKNNSESSTDSGPVPVGEPIIDSMSVSQTEGSAPIFITGLDVHKNGVSGLLLPDSVSVAGVTTTSSSDDANNNHAVESGVMVASAVPASLDVPASGGQSGPSASEGESSSGELLEDGAPTARRLKRRNRFGSRSKGAEAERYKTQPTELSDANSKEEPKRFKYEGRHKTQPITPSEMKEAEANSTLKPNLTSTPGGSIKDRLNQLKTSGEEEWRKKVRKDEDLNVLKTPAIVIPESVVKLREKSGSPVKRPTSIADRLNELESSKKTWKERVDDNDATQFTVAGKLKNTKTDSPLLSRVRSFKKNKDSNTEKDATPKSSPVTPTKDFDILKIPIPTEIISEPTGDVAPDNNNKKPAARRSVVRGVAGGDDGGEEAVKAPVKVEVPVIGEELDSFFNTKSIDQIKDKVDVDVDDFNDIFCEAEEILPTVRKPRPVRRAKSSNLNPLRNMAKTMTLQQEYLELSKGTAEKEFKRLKKEKLSKEAGFAQEALAGLASKENFKQVKLSRNDSLHGQQLFPFNDVMLMQVKGRRMVQTRLVEPHTKSLNAGDCFVLITPDKCITWEGQYANVIEKAKAADIASYVLTKKDMGCKKATEVHTVPQLRGHLGAGKHFHASLQGEKQCQDAGPDGDDELYESSMVRCNMVYRLDGNSLIPYKEYWGQQPKYEMMKKNEVMVFDFGTEFYLWQGKQVTMEQRKLGLKLARRLYDKGYDYSESAINPFSPLRTEEEGGLPLKAPARPKWVIFGKINQNMETVLFREKFSDWPDTSRIIGCKGHSEGGDTQKEQVLKPFDASLMIPLNKTPVSEKLDGEHIGRGLRHTEDMQGFMMEKDIITREVSVWHVLEYDHFRLPPTSHGQFHDCDTYVIRWQYMIANANLKTLKGTAARNSLTGRERCAYFFWQGNNSSINEKGASALMTVELDEERGPQVRVLEGKEPPCFLNLFEGKMVLHIGKREDPGSCTQGAWRLYCLRGDYEKETYLLEIPISLEHLRSRSSLVLLNVKTGITYIWHGAKSAKHTREICRKAVDQLAENRPPELGLHDKASVTVTEMEEGEEKSQFWDALDGKDRTQYHSLLMDPAPQRHTVRLFHMSSVNLVFEVHEQLNPSRVPDLVSPFPFLQSDLYKSAQPAIYLVDAGHCVYLWQGWWPVGSHEHENVHTGSATARFNMDRRCAMETTLHYCKEKNPSEPPAAYLVCAGMEPKCFTNLFPYWIIDNIVRDLAIEEGREVGYRESVADVLHRLTKTKYSLEELLVRPLPEGVDPLKMEAYLHDEEFEQNLGMNRDEFYSQPMWKQKQLKQQVGLF